MLHKSLLQFCNRRDEYRRTFQQYLKKQTFDKNDCQQVLQELGSFLMRRTCTEDIAECFPQYLIVILSITIEIKLNSSEIVPFSTCSHRKKCFILGRLISLHPDVLGFTLRYFENHPAPFEIVGNEIKPLRKRSKTEEPPFDNDEPDDYDIVKITLNILKVAPNHFKQKWKWSMFYHFLSHKNRKVQWYAFKCIAIVLNMSEAILVECAKNLIPDFDRFAIDAQEENKHTISIITDDDTTEIELAVKNTDSLVSVAGILLPIFNKKIQHLKSASLVAVPSMESNLRCLALAVAARKCICLQGPVGCGKTAMVEYLANVTGRGPSDIIKVQLGDQTDSKMLLGTYRCTDIPGEFVWQPGVLTQAVMSDKWLLLEDIDSAALDVASVLSNLMETRTLSVPGYRDIIYAKCGFQLFVTQRLITTASGSYKQSTGASNLLEKHWLCVNMDPLTKEELVTIVKTLFPKLATISTRMVDVFLLFSMSNQKNDIQNENLAILGTGRLTSTRDLIKWCTRAIVDYDVASPESALKVFQDAIDIFCCSVSDQTLRLDLAGNIALKLGIVKTKADYFVNKYKPSVTLESQLFVAGRAKVYRKNASSVQFNQTKVNFSFTRPSSVLLERVTSCVAQKEPVLLVGETGTGKTSSVQYLAKCTGHKLIVINMNQQSESADLLGGYKPVDIKLLITPIREEFEILFRSYYAIEPNRKFLEHIAACYKTEKWKTLVTLMCHSAAAAVKRLKGKIQESAITLPDNSTKKRSRQLSKKNDQPSVKDDLELIGKWEKILIKLEKFKSQIKSGCSLAFAFIEGSLIRALKEGHWVLLDEINLASSETLECLSGLLEGSAGSLSLLERGDNESVTRHPDFTMFACMNPATDVGKKELPVGLRNRFTEFYVDELTESNDLHLLINSYMADMNLPSTKIESIVKLYLRVKKEANNSLNDGTGHKPHYSLRTLCRALSIAASNPCGNVLRSLYEAFCLSFLTQLDHTSYPIVQRIITEFILDKKTMRAIISTPIPKPNGFDEDYINFQGYWVVKGNLEPEVPENYILTASVCRNLKDLVRVVSIGKIPVLLQGDTSVGKTSLITYLAKASGHICVRINNHEHTDLQEYVGSYIADETGKLVFKEGVLVEAMRRGHWIILDELNLAPSDVLEALNRVLDDNRELFIPETQETVKAHSNFMLFATQNPPGLYGGRKVLSRAFRNRFVELHFDEIPSNELEIILHERCKMPPSYCKKVIQVMTDLQMKRKTTAAFAGKQGFITLRDLFKWGERYRLAPEFGEGTDRWQQHSANEGYLVLAAKVRKPEECEEIRRVIKNRLNCDVDPSRLFTLNDKTSPVTKSILERILNNPVGKFQHVVWTYHMRRMAVLVAKSCQFREPVLLVGETGCGKTTVCQLAAAMKKRELYSVNCHMHTESSDFLGNLRPVRSHTESNNQKLFEWVDGPLVTAMRTGDYFLADEISLADDSVLERMNSLLEPERSILLAEKTTDSINPDQSDNIITAHEDFCFIGTMNPGGDYGKKELSPALRNRFTEIWCEECSADDDLQAIIEHNLHLRPEIDNQIISKAILKFLEWLKKSEIGKRFTISIRDIMTWVNFINACDGKCESKLSAGEAFFHGGCLTYIDSLGSGATGSESTDKLEEFRECSIKFLQSQSEQMSENCMNTESISEIDENTFGITPFFIPRGKSYNQTDLTSFTFTAPTTKLNILKVLRGLQLQKPLLLEGSPGVGKTSLVSAVAKASGHKLLRINLSDQTDISDLFGADLPMEGGKGGQFAWKDGPFLQALRAGDWILLDELNLASQSVLEGLNACFDHRGEIYIPELGRTFTVKPGTKLFGCQNPLRQGGARRGLPKSFLNRFTQVFVDALSADDLRIISQSQFPHLNENLIKKIVNFNSRISSEAGILWGHSGSPWEMNLRDIIRWCELIDASMDKLPMEKNLAFGVELIYADRMRTTEDKQKVRDIYDQVFENESPVVVNQPRFFISDNHLYFDHVTLPRTENSFRIDDHLLVMREQLPALRSLAHCIEMNWMPILVGGAGTGKTSMVRVLAQLTGQKLQSVVVNSAMDTTEILGGFEQTDYNRHLETLINSTENLLMKISQQNVNEDLKKVSDVHGLLEELRHSPSCDDNLSSTMTMATEFFLRRTEKLHKLISAMKTLELSCSTELINIEDKLQQLSALVKQDKCLNAGGKFEWVNSVLVKCLQDGSWLLLDQVNLCSPAVLDRLNGLLEPGGMLTIGERGVDGDGNIHTIRPHKNFRLFLTMDPRYGEISRAMRNRGVEICLPSCSKDSFEIDNLDIKSQLFSIGLINADHQEALLKIHQNMLDNNLIAEIFGVIELFHAAFLITQQISRGFSVIEAFKMAGTDVYIKSKNIHNSTVRESLTLMIEETIRKYESAETENLVVDLNTVTLRVADLQEYAVMSLIKQQISLLALLFDRRNSTNVEVYPATTKFINDYLNSSRNDADLIDIEIEKILPYLIINFYEKSTINDVGNRTRYIMKLLAGSENNSFAAIVDSMQKEIQNFAGKSSNHSLPWYPLFSPIDSSDSQVTSSLKLAMTMCLKAMKIDRNNNDIKQCLDMNRKTISVDNYSNAIYNKKLADRINMTLVTMFFPFAEKLNSWCFMYLQKVIDRMDFKEYIELRRKFQWVKRFYQQGELILIDRTDPGNSKNASFKLDKVDTLLKIHYKWMKKFIDETISHMPNEDESADIKFTREKIGKLLQEIDVNVYSVDVCFQKFTKMIKKNIVTPLPFNSEAIITSYQKLKSITKDMSPIDNILQYSALAWETRIILLHFEENLKQRNNLIEIWTNLANEEFDKPEIFSDPITHAENLRDQYCLSLCTRNQISDAIQNILSTQSDRALTEMYSRIQLYPIYEYAFFLFANKFHSMACKKINIHDINIVELVNSSLFKFVDIPSISMNLIGVMSAICNNSDNPIKLTRLVNELFRSLTRLSANSNAFKSPDSMIKFTEITEESLEQLSVDAEVTSPIIHATSEPILIMLVSKLILDDSKSSTGEQTVLGSASLGSYKSKVKQLKTLNDILWQNSIAFNSKEYAYTINDREALVSYSENYIEAVERIGGEQWERDVLQNSKVHTEEADLIYQREYRNPLDELKFHINELKSQKPLEFEAIERGFAWVLLGYHQLFILTNLEFIDPIQKTDLKIKYTDEDIEDLRNMIYGLKLESYAFGDHKMNEYDPRVSEGRRCLQNLSLKKVELVASKGFRSSTTKYIDLVREMINFRQTIGSWSKIVKPIKNLYDISTGTKTDSNENAEIFIEKINERIGSIEILQRSLHEFSERIESEFLSNYREIVSPILTSLAEVKHGSKILLDEVKRLVAERKNNCAPNLDVQSFMHNLIRFPTIGTEQKNLLQLIELCTSQNSRRFIDGNINATCSMDSLIEQFRMLKNGLNELYNHVSLTKQLTQPLWLELNALLQQVVILWQKKEMEKEKAAEEEASLYKNKATSHGQTLSEEEEITEELKNLFPTHRENDFNEIDIDNAQLDAVDKKCTETPLAKEYVRLITEEDIHEVHKIHARIVESFVPAPWLNTLQNSETRNYIEPLVQRFYTFAKIRPSVESSLTLDLSSKLYTSFNILTSVATNASQGKKFSPEYIYNKKSYDFYKNSNIEEVKQCLPILEAITIKVNGFLKEWPEHPTLRWIIIIIQRINKFSVLSPVSRFLTGLELLLVKMREWEENAHSGVSLAEYSTSLIQQIIQWRKLELNCWKDCLNTAFERLEAKTSKWWFFIYAVVESYINKSSLEIEIPDGIKENLPVEEIITAKDLIEKLEIFMNQSPLVEFQARLNLLYTFHAHAFYLKSGDERDELVAIFWNIYNYYKQFAGDVQGKIKSLKAPIEKKLKDFVKIARWNDINYWSVKETVEKTHRTLHKFIREYETGLKQLVGTLLIVRPSSTLIDSNKEENIRSKEQVVAIDVNDFIISTSLQDYVFEIPSITESSLIPKIEKLITKAKQLCKKTILMSSYPGIRTELEEFIDDYMSHSIRLKDMDIDRTLPKAKQKSHAKSILQQKRMALADYFKNLTNMGVSYRRGSLAWKNQRDLVINMTVAPLEVFVSLKQISNLDKVDRQMMSQWDGCELYYYKSLIKLNALNSALTKPQSDLGIQNMDRCSGYSNHLMMLAHDQKKTLTESFSHFLCLKQKIEQFGAIDSNVVCLPTREEINDSANDLKSLLITLQTGLEQLELYLLACPEDNHVEGNMENFQLEIVSLPVIKTRKGDQVWESTNGYLKKSKKMVESLSQECDNLFSKTSVSIVRTSKHFNFLKNSCHNLEKVHQLLADCRKIFGNDHPVSEIFEFINSNVQSWMTKFNGLSNGHESIVDSEDQSKSEELIAKIEEFIKSILLVIQEKYKEASSEDVFQSPVPNTEDENEDDDHQEKTQLEENGLHEKLIQSLKKDINNLRLKNINSKLDEILVTSQLMNGISFVRCNQVLLRCLPLLKQYSLFAQFYLSEEVVAFRTTCKLLNLQLNIFLDLVTNGFCIPKDLDLEEGDNDQDGVDQKDAKGGMGLGDGEGQKDMSDQIESEDQLEDARPADEEKKSEEDKDCKEEENGIDMSENFESKLQDMEKNEDDEDKNDDGEDDKDLDKEMGDTEDGVDQLDKEIWGDEDEKEEEEENIDSDEQGKGEQTGEKEMSAKDDSTDRKNEAEDDEKREIDQDEEKEEINEINEPDVNDDQINPYHGNQEPPPEPEAMDLPDDLNLDGEDEGKEDKNGEENPFDIDEMKESALPAEKDEPENIDDGEKNEEDEPNEDSSDDENDTSTTADPGMKDLDETEDPDESDKTGQEQNEKDKEEEEEGENPDSENKEETGEEIAPSRTDTNEVTNDQEQLEDKTQGSRDKTMGQSNESEKQESTPTENNYDDGKDNGSGQAQSEELDDGHSGAIVAKRAPTQSQNEDKKQEKRKSPGERDDNHALVDNVQPDKKKQKMINKSENPAQDENNEGIENDEESEMDMCQHVKDSDVSDGYAMDAATEEQIKKQQITNLEEEKKEDEEESAMDIDMHEDEEEIVDNDDVKPLKSKPELKSKSDKKNFKPSVENLDDQMETQTQVDVDGKVVETSGVSRSAESAFYTNFIDPNEFPTTSMQVERTRMEVQNMLGQWTRSPLAEEALKAWNCLSIVTESPARDLSEKLRLVLEPTQATRLKGDYRTGKRINMRKIIPYVASQFRKDKIWLRRTKPSKRDYQIVLAVDDSKSMKDNQSKELAFESLSLISKAMEYLEVGQLGVISFGEDPKILHPLGEPFNEQSGSRLMQELRFEQKETRVHSLVNFTVDMFENQVKSNDNARLMLILSDGRNINSQGASVINRAVRRAKLANIFIVFIIVEDQNSEFSVLDTIEANVQDGKLIKRPYMDSFPFPFYMILKDITALPGVLSDALRQWFEIVGKIDN